MLDKLKFLQSSLKLDIKYADISLNSKYEKRNPKQIRNSNSEISKLLKS